MARGFATWALALCLSAVGCNSDGPDDDDDVALPDLCDDASGQYDLSIDWGASPGACGLSGEESMRWDVAAQPDGYDVSTSDQSVSGTAETEINASGDCIARLTLRLERGPTAYDMSGALTELDRRLGGVGSITDGMCTQTWAATGSRSQ